MITSSRLFPAKAVTALTPSLTTHLTEVPILLDNPDDADLLKLTIEAKPHFTRLIQILSYGKTTTALL
jgi:hypothetical protein